MEARTRKKTKQYTDEQLLNYLREYTKRTGLIPTKRAIEADDTMPSKTTYEVRFGSLGKALKAAGLAKVEYKRVCIPCVPEIPLGKYLTQRLQAQKLTLPGRLAVFLIRLLGRFVGL